MSHASARPKIRRGSALVAAAIAAALTLAGCTASGEAAGSAPTSAAVDGVVIEHGHGKTVIPEKPQRVVALGWMTPDIVAALGTNPVGIEEVWGADESGYQPWFEDYVTEEYGETPEIIPFVEDGPNYEAIKELKPDLILSLYSGVTDIEYERLSEIAPTVPYIEGPWNPGTWEGMTRTVGKALSEDAKAEELIAETEEQITTLAGRAPRVPGQDLRLGSDPERGRYRPRRLPRVRPARAHHRGAGLHLHLGDGQLPRECRGRQLVQTGVSLENLYDVQADLFAAWGGSADEGKYTVENKVVSRWEPIAAGSYVIYANDAEASAISAPTVLSLKYILPKYVDDLAAALQGEPTIDGK